MFGCRASHADARVASLRPCGSPTHDSGSPWIGRDRNQARALSGGHPPQATFPEAPLRSRTVGFPESGSGLGSPRHFSERAFLHDAKLRCWRTLRPDVVEFAPPLRHDTGTAEPPAQRLAANPSSWPPSAQSPFAQLGRYPNWGGLEGHLEEHYPLVVAHTGSCARPSPSPRLRFARCAHGLCRLSPVPAARWPFPTLSPRSLRGCSDPYPAALPSCTRPLLRQGHRPHPRVDGFGARNSPHMAASVGTSISRLQSFDHLRAPTLARPPDCSHRSATSTLGGQAVHTTHSPTGYPDRDVASLRARHGQLARLDSHQLDRGLVGCSLLLRCRALSGPPAGSVGCVSGRVVVGRARRGRASRVRSRRVESGIRMRVG